MTTFYLMRHALTPWNKEKRMQGQTDVPLAPEGEDMARGWAESLHDLDADIILTSGLIRAEQTASFIAQRNPLPMEHDSRLMELDWGNWAGYSKAQIREIRHLVRAQEERGFDFRPLGGESRREMLSRATEALCDAAARHPGGKVLVVTHNGVLRVLFYHLLGLTYLPGEPSPLEPYRLHTLSCDPGAEPCLRIVELNREI